MGKLKKGKYRRGIFLIVYTINKKGKIKYLIFHRKLHWKGWEFPKGGLEKKEKFLEGVKRELKEEVGLKIISIKKHNISGRYRYSKMLPDRDGIIGQTYSLFSIEVEKGKPKIDNLEHDKYSWKTFEKAIKKLTWPNQRKCLRIVNAFLKSKKHGKNN